MLDVGGCGGSGVARAMAREIQLKIRVSLYMGLQGRVAVMHDLGGITSNILQLGFYKWSSREHA